MCGIFGYVGGETDLGESVLQALEQLQYRGYDSWGVGIAVDGQIEVQKQPGKYPAPQSISRQQTSVSATPAGRPTEASPVQCPSPPGAVQRLAVIHNGIVENFRALKDEVRGLARFQSETDSKLSL